MGCLYKSEGPRPTGRGPKIQVPPMRSIMSSVPLGSRDRMGAVDAGDGGTPFALNTSGSQNRHLHLPNTLSRERPQTSLTPSLLKRIFGHRKSGSLLAIEPFLTFRRWRLRGEYSTLRLLQDLGQLGRDVGRQSALATLGTTSPVPLVLNPPARTAGDIASLRGQHILAIFDQAHWPFSLCKKLRYRRKHVTRCTWGALYAWASLLSIALSLGASLGTGRAS